MVDRITYTPRTFQLGLSRKDENYKHQEDYIAQICEVINGLDIPEVEAANLLKGTPPTAITAYSAPESVADNTAVLQELQKIATTFSQIVNVLSTRGVTQ